MKILMVQDTFLPLVGGAEIHVLNLAKALRRRGHEVEIATATAGGPEVDGFRVWRFPRGRSASGSLRWLATHGPAFRRLVRRHDVVHGHYTYFMSAAFGSVARLEGRPFLVTLHGLNTLDSSVGRSMSKRAARALSFRAAHRVLATSDEMADVARRFVPESRIEVLPNAVDCATYEGLVGKAPHPPPHRVLVVRRLAPKNGVQYLVEAAPAVLRAMGEPVEFHVAGDGRLMDHCRRRVRELGVDASFTFHGVVQNQNVGALLGAAHVVVFPSSAESTSIAALEAMAAGRPVVASAVGAFPDMLGHGARGRLVTLFDRSDSDYDAPLTLPQDRLDALAGAIVDTLKDRGRADARAKAALAHVRLHHDWSGIAGRLEALYAALGRKEAPHS